MDKKWPEKTAGDIPYLPKKSYVSRNWKNTSIQEWTNTHCPGTATTGNLENPRDNFSGGVYLSYDLKKNEPFSQLASKSASSPCEDDETNDHSFMQIDWTSSGLSPLNWSVTSDIRADSPGSFVNSLPQTSIPSHLSFQTDNELERTGSQSSQFSSNKNVSNSWSNSLNRYDDKIYNSHLVQDKSVTSGSNLIRTTLENAKPQSDENTSNGMCISDICSSNSIFQRKYGLGNPSYLNLDGINHNIDENQSNGIINDSGTVLKTLGIPAHIEQNVDNSVHSYSENGKWQVEQSPFLSSSTDTTSKSDVGSKGHPKIDKNETKNDKIFNFKKDISKTCSHNEVVPQTSTGCNSLEMQDITSTSQDIKPSPVKDKKCLGNHKECQVCGDRSAGFYCNAFICEACKKFFMRACKQEKLKYVCLRDKKCAITKESRVQCQYCRYQKCLQLNMFCPASGGVKKDDKTVSEIPCRVCGAPSSGFHFGALTCEGCKGFFRRMAKERETNRYHCSKGGSCEINTLTRNMCKACRYKKCLEADMSIEASRIGRQPNAVKHAISLELQNRTMKMEADLKIFPDQVAEIPSHVKEEPTSPRDCADCSAGHENSSTDMNNSDVYISGTSQLKYKDEEMLNPMISESITNIQDIKVSDVDLKPEENVKYRDVKEEDTDEDWLEVIQKFEKADECLLPLNTRCLPNGVDSKNFENDATCWKMMMDEFDQHAYCIIKFAKKIPGFKMLSMDDQVKLIQGSIYPIVILNHSRVFDMKTKSFNYFNFEPQEMEQIFALFPMLKILATHFLHAGEMVHALQLDDLEYCLLSVLLLYNGDVPDLEDPRKVVELQEEIGYTLQMYEEKKQKDGMTRYGLLLLRLAELHFFTVQHDLAIRTLLMTHPSVEVPQLYQEIILKLNN